MHIKRIRKREKVGLIPGGIKPVKDKELMSCYEFMNDLPYYAAYKMLYCGRHIMTMKTL